MGGAGIDSLSTANLYQSLGCVTQTTGGIYDLIVHVNRNITYAYMDNMPTVKVVIPFPLYHPHMGKCNCKLPRNTAEFVTRKICFLGNATTPAEGEIMFEFPLVKVAVMWYNTG